MITYGINRFISTNAIKWKSFYAVCIMVMVLFVLLTFSRRGYITMLIGSVLLLWWWKGNILSRLRIVLIGSLALSLIIIILSVTPIGQLAINRSTERLFNNPCFRARTDDGTLVLEELGQQPITMIWGFGMASTGPVGMRFGVPNASPVHNYYLMCCIKLASLVLVYSYGYCYLF